MDDAERRVEVAKNDLLPGLDLEVDYRAISDPGDTTPSINADRRRWEVGLDLDLPLDRKAERNRYTRSLIDVQRAGRAKQIVENRIRLEIANNWRDLEQASADYRIAQEGVDLSLRRLEEQRLLAELGKGTARDLVDAQNDLVNAQNQLTAALIDHYLTRLRLWRDLGILYIEADGSWETKLRNEG